MSHSEPIVQHNITDECHICFVAATLTSYSENMERGGKYGEGSRGNLKLWQSQKSGMDSYLYRVDENMTASTYSLNKIPERNLDSMSSHSAHSIPLYLMPRPNSVAGESLPFPSPSWESRKGARNKVIYRCVSLQCSNYVLSRKQSLKNWMELPVFVMFHPISESFSARFLLLSTFLS